MRPVPSAIICWPRRTQCNGQRRAEPGQSRIRRIGFSPPPRARTPAAIARTREPGPFNWRKANPFGAFFGYYGCGVVFKLDQAGNETVLYCR